MLLQQIVELLDTELERLTELRSILSGLNGTVATQIDEPLALVIEAAALEPVKKRIKEPAHKESVKESTGAEIVANPKPAPPKRVGRPRKAPERSARAVAHEQTALNGSIPRGPVVVSPAVLAKEHAAKRDSRETTRHREPEPAKGTLGSMIRALHLDAL